MKVRTKLTKDQTTATETELTIAWDGVTDEQLRALATKSVVIAWQSLVRDAGTIPAADTIAVTDLLNKQRKVKAPPKPEDIATKAANSPEYLAELLKALRAAGAAV